MAYQNKSQPWRGLQRKHRAYHESRNFEFQHDDLYGPGTYSDPFESQSAGAFSGWTRRERVSKEIPRGEHKNIESVEEMSREYQELGPMLRALQTAESSTASDAQITRNRLASQLSEMLESLKAIPVGSRSSILRHLLGTHTTISSPADKKSDYLWTRGSIRPRKIPKSIIWSPKKAGSPELVLAEVYETDKEKNEQHESAEKAADVSKMPTDVSTKTESKVRRHNSKSNSVIPLRAIIERCGELLSSVQSAQKGRRVALEDEDREQVKAEVSELQQCVSALNENLIGTGAVQWDDVRKALTAVLGTPGQLWTKQHPDGRDVRLFFNERMRHLELLVKKPRASTTRVQIKVREDDSHIDPKSDIAVSLKPSSSTKHGEESKSKAIHKEQNPKDKRGSGLDEAKNWTKRQNGSNEPCESDLTDVRNLTLDDASHDMPVSVPHTTAASTFVYGVNAVLAALSAKKRQLYHLYIDTTKSGDWNRDKILSLAKDAKVPMTSNANKRLLDRMSNGRPHNGIVLEASQVPSPPTLGLGKPNLQAASISVQLDVQSAEDISVNGTPSSLSILTKTWRYPFVLMLDGILDEGNMGNILRTAYFYGVDAVAISKNTCASINSAIVAKASSGAIEAVQLLSLPAPSKFVYNSLRASWKVYAAVAPPLVVPSSKAGKYLSHSKVATSSPLRDYPCILMLGAEGEGLRDNLKNRADYFVSIEQGDRPGGAGGLLPGIGVDSMNVSSAAGILVESFMRKPAGAQPLMASGALGF